MADDYWIDVHQGSHTAAGKLERAKGKSKLGADDYAIGEGSLKGHGGAGHSGYHGRGSRWQTPLFYIIDNMPTGVTVTADDQDVPDEVTGPPIPDRLMAGQSIALPAFVRGANDRLRSKNGRATLILQGDSNLVLYAGPSLTAGHDLWASNSVNSGGTKVVMQTDGNLVMIDTRTGRPTWASGTPGHPGSYLVIQNDGNVVLCDAQGPYWALGTDGFKRASGTPWYRGKTTGLVADIVHSMNSAAAYAGKEVSAAGQALSSIPIVGPLAAAAAKLNPVAAVGNLVSSVAHGERIDHAFIDAAKGQIAAIREVAPFAAKIASFVPGVGTGVAAAIAAGTALAEGRTISQAVVDGIKGALPAGTAPVFDAVDALASGQSLTAAAVKAASQYLPPAAQLALKSIPLGTPTSKERAIQAVRAALPPAHQKVADIAVATAVAKNVQSAVSHAVTKAIPVFAKHGALVTKSVPHFARVANALSVEQRRGYDAAMGILGHRGISAQTLMAMRSKFPATQQQGFDRAIKVYSDHFTPHAPTLIAHGIVMRGNWIPDRNGVRGRLIQNGKVSTGTFKRTA